MTRQRREKIKRDFKAKGWSYRAAAKELEVSFEHLNRVLNGHRESRRLLTEVEKLPTRPAKAAK